MTDIEIDPLTGMLKVPEGYFWRVTSSGGLFRIPLVQLRKRVWKFSYLVDETGILDHELTPSGILESAEYILSNQEKWAKHAEAVNKYYGDYPPKKLEK